MRFKKTASRAVSLLIFAIFGLSLFVFITIIANRGGVPSFYGYSFLSVSTASMEPVYPVNSILVIQKIDADELMVGDVISFYSKDPSIYGKPNTHRIESKGFDGENRLFFITKGDNNPVADRYWVYEDMIIGKVRRSIPLAGLVMNKINNRFVLFFLLIVPLFFVVFWEVGHLKKLFKSKANDDDQYSVPAAEIPADAPPGTEKALLDKINRIQAEIDRLKAAANNSDDND